MARRIFYNSPFAENLGSGDPFGPEDAWQAYMGRLNELRADRMSNYFNTLPQLGAGAQWTPVRVNPNDPRSAPYAWSTNVNGQTMYGIPSSYDPETGTFSNRWPYDSGGGYIPNMANVREYYRPSEGFDFKSLPDFDIGPYGGTGAGSDNRAMALFSQPPGFSYLKHPQVQNDPGGLGGLLSDVAGLAPGLSLAAGPFSQVLGVPLTLSQALSKMTGFDPASALGNLWKDVTGGTPTAAGETAGRVAAINEDSLARGAPSYIRNLRGDITPTMTDSPVYSADVSNADGAAAAGGGNMFDIGDLSFGGWNPENPFGINIPGTSGAGPIDPGWANQYGGAANYLNALYSSGASLPAGGPWADFSGSLNPSSPGVWDLIKQYGPRALSVLSGGGAGAGTGGGPGSGDLSWLRLLGAGAGALAGGLGGARQSGTITQVQDIPDWLKPYVAGNITAAQNAMQGIDLNNPLLPQAQAQLGRTIGGEYLSPSSNPYLMDTYTQAARAVTDAYNSSVAPRNAFAFGRGGQAFDDNSAYAETEARNRFGLGQNLQNLATNIFGGNYNTERGRQFEASQIAPSFVNARTAATFAPFSGMSAQFPNLRTSSQPYFENPWAGALGGALLGSRIFR